MEFILLIIAVLLYLYRDSILGLFFGFVHNALFKLFFPVIKRVNPSYARWDKLPTLIEYLEAYPEAKAQEGIKCNVCNSSHIRNWGISHANSKFRIFLCNHCDTDLYKK